MNTLIRKLSSRKLWAAVAGVVAGLAMVFGLDEGIIDTVAGAVVAVASVVTYIVTEGRIDAEAVKKAAEAVQDARRDRVRGGRGMNLHTQYLTKNPCYRAGKTIAVKGLMLHSVGAPQPDPASFVRSWDSASFTSACVHGFVGGDDAYITLPALEEPGRAHRGWHCGGAANNTHIGIEMCEPAGIRYTGGSGFTVADRDGAAEFVRKTTQTAVELFAELCAFHGLDPLKPGVIISHAEGHRLGIASNHGDPEHLWRGLGMDYDMDAFRAAVAAEMAAKKEDDGMTYEQWKEYIARYEAERASAGPSAWSAEARIWAERSGIITGDDKGNMQYKAACTREQMVVFLHRLYKLITGK